MPAPTPPLPEWIATDDDDDDLEARALELKAYRQRLEREVLVAEEIARIDTLLRRRASARPPPPAADVPAVATRPSACTGADSLAPSSLYEDDDWSARSGAAVMLDRSMISASKKPAISDRTPFLATFLGVVLSVLLAAIATRSESHVAAPPTSAVAPAPTFAPLFEQEVAPPSLPRSTAAGELCHESSGVTVRQPVVAERVVADLGPRVDDAVTDPRAAREAAQRAARHAARDKAARIAQERAPSAAPTAAPAMAPAQVAAPAPVASPPTNENERSADLEQAARTAKMLRAQLAEAVGPSEPTKK